MDIVITNCNNILEGAIHLEEGALNIKYAINGTGKSTIAKAMLAETRRDESALMSLKPYSYLVKDGEEDLSHEPSVSGMTSIQNVMIFDEDYVNQYVYQPEEILKNSFEVFVKTPDYDRHLKQIQQLLEEIRIAFQKNPELDDLIMAFTRFLEGCGKSQTGLAASGSILKGLGRGNKINCIPEGLEAYRPYLNNTKDAGNVKWLKWQSDGKHYLDIADQCPYCSGSIEDTKEGILRLSQEYDSKAIEHLNRMLEVFAQLSPYMSDKTNQQISAIANNVGDMSAQQKSFLYEIKNQVATVCRELTNLKNIGYQSLKDVDAMAEKIGSYAIDLSLFSHLQSELTHEKIDRINESLAVVIKKAGELQGEINKQNALVRNTINENRSAINNFLKCAGYAYIVDIEEADSGNYRMVLKPAGVDSEVLSAKDHLSFGERNALALALFMYGALKEDPDLIVLDDPISSFDGNKRFALLNLLFMSEKCLRNRSVLLLTHDFNTVIDVVYTMPYNFSPAPKAAFMWERKGVLREKTIIKNDIKSFRQIALDAINDSIDSLNKLIFLRRLYEIESENDTAWQLISNLFHKRELPEYRDADNKRDMTEGEIECATDDICSYISDFDYKKELAKVKDDKALIALYRKSSSNYEKLQIYRILNNENHNNPVVKKYINEMFHVENDYLFQLDPREYDSVPQFIIVECDREVDALELVQ